jgi:hypothetical protein
MVLLHRIWGFHSGGYKEYHLLGYDATQRTTRCHIPEDDTLHGFATFTARTVHKYCIFNNADMCGCPQHLSDPRDSSGYSEGEPLEWNWQLITTMKNLKQNFSHVIVLQKGCLKRYTYLYYCSSFWEVILKELYVDSCRHQNHFEVRALIQETFNNTKEKVTKQVAFMYLIQHQYVIIRKRWICRDLWSEVYYRILISNELLFLCLFNNVLLMLTLNNVESQDEHEWLIENDWLILDYLETFLQLQNQMVIWL